LEWAACWLSLSTTHGSMYQTNYHNSVSGTWSALLETNSQWEMLFQICILCLLTKFVGLRTASAKTFLCITDIWLQYANRKLGVFHIAIWCSIWKVIYLKLRFFKNGVMFKIFILFQIWCRIRYGLPSVICTLIHFLFFICHSNIWYAVYLVVSFGMVFKGLSIGLFV
jgi:hypothetical protein